MACLTLRLLGTPRLTRNNDSLDGVFFEKVEALLCYLAVESSRPHRREVLAELFWPNLPDAHARSNLRYALFKLREGLCDKQNTEPHLQVSRTSIRFNVNSDYYLDIEDLADAFDQTLQPNATLNIERLENLVSLHRGDFMEQNTLTQNELFHEWLCNKREIYHRNVMFLLSRLIDKHADAQSYEHAVHYAYKFIALDPLDESGYHRLIELLAISWKNTKALETYNILSGLLDMEIGIRPNEKSTALIQELLYSRTSSIASS